MEADTINEKPRAHHGRNMRRIREIMGVKQDVIADALQISQPAVHNMEQKAVIDDETLEKVAKVLNVPVDAIKNYQEEATINFIANNFHDCNAIGSNYNANQGNYGCSFNPIDKIVELYNEKSALYERLLEAERAKNK